MINFFYIKDSVFFWPLTIATLLFGISVELKAQLAFVLEYWSLFLIIISALGVPHGFLDPYIALDSSVPIRFHKAVFFTSYIIISIFCCLLWQAFPQTSLITFLLISSYHFGGDFCSSNAFIRLSIGSLIILLPFSFHPGEVQSIFFIISGLNILFLKNLLYVFMIAIMTHTLSSSQINDTSKYEITTLMALAYVAHPLIFFTVYFCFLHSMRHYYENRRYITFSYRFIGLVTALSFITLSMATLKYEYHYYHQSIFFDATLKTLFIGLFALTVPHMLVVEAAKLTNKERC